MPSNLESVSGFSDVASWFGRWPSFHDAEILQICLNRVEPSFVRVLTWLTGSEVDEQGFFVQKKHAVVVFVLDDVQDMSLEGFNCQNVISGLAVETGESGVKLVMYPCYGVSGTLQAKELRLELHPGAAGH